MAEAILGAAIVAKICNRGPNGVVGKISANDVLKIVKIMQKLPLSKKGATKAQIKVDSGGSAKDRITFFLNLGMKMMQEFKVTQPMALQRLAQGAASYANSPRIDALAQAMYNNNINNKLEIDVDGISANTTTKSDVMVRTDKYVFDKISLKAGNMKTGHSLGQVGGNSWSSLMRVFNEGTNERTKRKEVGLKINMNTRLNEDKYMELVGQRPSWDTVSKGVRFAYKKAADEFNRLSVPQIAANVFEFLRFHAARNDTDVKIVKLHLGKHKTLDPLKLEPALKDLKSIKAMVRLDTQWPIFMVYDASTTEPPPSTIYSPNVIFSVTVKIDSRQMGYIYHLVKEGARFQTLLEE